MLITSLRFIIYMHHIHVQKCFWLIVTHEGNTIHWLVSQNVKAWKIVLYCKFNKSEGISCILHQWGQAQLLKKKTGKKSMKKNSGKVAKFLYLVVQTCKCSPKKCPQHVFLFLKLFANIFEEDIIRYPFVIIVQQHRKKITIETCYRKWLAGTNRA